MMYKTRRRARLWPHKIADKRRQDNAAKMSNEDEIKQDNLTMLQHLLASRLGLAANEQSAIGANSPGRKSELHIAKSMPSAQIISGTTPTSFRCQLVAKAQLSNQAPPPHLRPRRRRSRTKKISDFGRHDLNDQINRTSTSCSSSSSTLRFRRRSTSSPFRQFFILTLTALAMLMAVGSLQNIQLVSSLSSFNSPSRSFPGK